MSDGVAVSLEGVSKSYGRVRALVNAHGEFRGGEVHCVEGPNGSGKSTLLSLLGCLAVPSAGKIRFGRLGEDKFEVRRVLGWVGHESLCYGDLTGRENIELAAVLRGLDPIVAFERARSRFELGDFVDRPMRTYSRGQRQKVALARALVHDPRLLLFDEPTTGLDEKATGMVARVIREESQRGSVVVVVTHDSAFAREVADRRWRMGRGRLEMGV